MVEVGIAWQQPQGCGFGLSSMVKRFLRSLDLKRAHSSGGEWRSTAWLHVLLWALGLLVSQMSEFLESGLDFPGHLPWGVCVVS